MKLTPWYPAHVKPVRKGVYEMDAWDSWFRYWDGKHWYCGAFTPEDAYEEWLDGRTIADADFDWRGLASPSGK